MLKSSLHPTHRNTSKIAVSGFTLSLSPTNENETEAAVFVSVSAAEASSTSSTIEKTQQEDDKKYQLSSPISYFQHEETGLFDDTYCVLDSKREECCSQEHCATVVARSTLYSECCQNVHSPESTQYSQVFPLLITSSPRSGTWFMQQLLTKTGLQGMTTDEHSPHYMGTVSWKHVFQSNGYYSGRSSMTHLYKSKFQMIWHLVRDPLNCLTSIAFTEALWEDTERSKTYIEYISRHVPLTSKSTLMERFNITQQEMEQLLQNQFLRMVQPTAAQDHNNSKFDHFRIYRALEIYMHWHGFINQLNVPLFRLEDLYATVNTNANTTKMTNVTILDEIFRSIGLVPPPHEKVVDLLTAPQNQLHQRRHRKLLLQQQHQQQQLVLGRKLEKVTPLPKRGKRIRKGARIHRSTLTWEEVCRTSVPMAKSLLKMSQSFGYYKELKVRTLCDNA